MRCMIDRRAGGALSTGDANVPYTLGKGCYLKGQMMLRALEGWALL